ncbi:hypothetical protein N0V87_001289 [Didymella glomerata]|uniref:Phosphoglycerate mutase n=1 Tax=Didymella glomerata TaxID=749621 RepID=A0A9W8X6M1_9PLEO|nr:hypothetical protein N0V87_001289 [Didymella glomerata]
MSPTRRASSVEQAEVACPKSSPEKWHAAISPYRSIKRLQNEYGNIVNFERCYELSDYDSKSGTFAPDGQALEGRAATLRKFLRDREEEEIVVVSHGQFLHYVSRDVDDDGKQINGDWENTEYRSYIFWPVEHEDALLKETDESVKRRNASGPGKQLGSADDA